LKKDHKTEQNEIISLGKRAKITLNHKLISIIKHDKPRFGASPSLDEQLLLGVTSSFPDKLKKPIA
jgi:hypothetical protein